MIAILLKPMFWGEKIQTLFEPGGSRVIPSEITDALIGSLATRGKVSCFYSYLSTALPEPADDTSVPDLAYCIATPRDLRNQEWSARIVYEKLSEEDRQHFFKELDEIATVVRQHSQTPIAIVSRQRKEALLNDQPAP